MHSVSSSTRLIWNVRVWRGQFSGWLISCARVDEGRFSGWPINYVRVGRPQVRVLAWWCFPIMYECVDNMWIPLTYVCWSVVGSFVKWCMCWAPHPTRYVINSSDDVRSPPQGWILVSGFQGKKAPPQPVYSQIQSDRDEKPSKPHFPGELPDFPVVKAVFPVLQRSWRASTFFGLRPAFLHVCPSPKRNGSKSRPT